MVTKLADKGDLFNYVAQTGGLKVDEARYVFLQIIDGVSYIHGKGIAHREL